MTKTIREVYEDTKKMPTVNDKIKRKRGRPTKAEQSVLTSDVNSTIVIEKIVSNKKRRDITTTPIKVIKEETRTGWRRSLGQSFRNEKMKGVDNL